MRRQKSNRTGTRRSGKIPRTLIDASFAVTRKEGLMTMAAAMRSLSPCHAGILAQYARQIGDGFSEINAIASYVEVPSHVVFAETTISEPTFAEPTYTELTYIEAPLI